MSSIDIRAIDETDLKKEPAPTMRHEYRVLLAEDAFDRAVERGASDTTREIGGVLVGELLCDDAGPYLAIETTIDALHAEEKGAELTFTHATWEHIHKEMDSRHQGKRVVGWYHTHPGFGVFLSDRDQFIHKSFFDLPFQVAFVYDPKSKEHGMFTWRDNEVVRTRRYWVGTREQQWDGPRSKAAPEKKAEEKTEPAAEKAAEARDEGMPISSSLLVVAVVLVLIAGFIGHWIGSASAGRGVAEAQIDVVKAKNEGAQLAISTLQSDLVGMLRETLGDQAVRKPTVQAINEIDHALATLQAPPTGAGSGSAGSGSAGSGSAAATTSEDRIHQAVTQLKTARESLVKLHNDRNSAETVLAKLEQAARRGNDLRADLAHDVAEQRSGLGRLYAETSLDAVKANDLPRARRLLATAAHLDPGNRARYEKQLQTFDKSGTLPNETEDPSSGSGSGEIK